MNVLLAFDKFKDSMTAAEACACAARALGEKHPDWQVECAPLTDGGEGFAEILTKARGGELRKVRVRGPRGVPCEATLGLLSLDGLPEDLRRLFAPKDSGLLALADMSSASGLALLSQQERDPLQSSSYGTGELIAAARHLGAEALLLGVGGSATNDLGLGALCAMGLRCKTATGASLPGPLPPARWNDIDAFEGQPSTRPSVVRIACDVNNPLLGERGATSVFGPQKGLKPKDRDALETSMARVARLLCSHFDKPETSLSFPGAGAAGGMAFGLACGADAKLLPGFELVSSWLDLERKIRNADIVLTGEGRFDESSLHGKGPAAIAALARSHGRQVHLFAGKLDVPQGLPGLSLHAISPSDLPLQEALKRGPDSLFSCVLRTL